MTLMMTHDWPSSQMKCHLHWAEQQDSPSNVTKYCACYEKWLSWLILVADEPSFTLRGATGATLQRRQILRLPRKMTRQNLREMCWNSCMKRHLQWRRIRTRSEHNPNPNSSSRTRPFAEVTFRASETHCVLKVTTFRLSIQISPNAAPATKSDTSPNAVPATKKNDAATEPATKSQMWVMCWLMWVMTELVSSDLFYSELLSSELFYSELLS